MGFHQPINGDEFKVKLYVNIFPSEDFDWDCLKIDMDKKVLYVRHLFEFHSSVNIKPLPKFWCFKTNGIFLNCCQDEVYSTVTSHIFEKIFLGLDYTMMSYGQNNSGKSFMMSGFYNQYEVRGITPRFVVDLFKQLEKKLEDYTPKVYVSVVDIYKNAVYDLLYHKTVCKELKNVREVEVLSQFECLEILFKAEAHRGKVANRSYSSHSGTNVVTFTVKLISVNCNEPNDKVSKIHFVDLAGVETVFRNPQTSFKNPLDQGNANYTKTTLELYGLRLKKSGNSRAGQNIHVLTRYLNKSFSSSSCISLICHIRPNHEDIKITLSALKFGKIIQGIPIRQPEEQTDTNYDMTLKKLMEEIKLLNDELMIVDLIEKKTPLKISQERLDFVKKTVQSFLDGELSENDILSLVDDPNLILNVIKSVHNQPILKSSVILQTDFPPDSIVSRTSCIQKDSIQKDSIQNDSIKKDSVIIDQSPKPTKKKVSMKDTSKGKAEKTKDISKSKVVEKGVPQSQEVQVNLVEPNVVLPTLESREGLWAMFLISRPDIHEVFDKLNASVAEKNKKLCNESTAYDSINQSLNKTQLGLNQLVTFRHTEIQEIYDQEGKVIVPEDEANLVQEHRQLQRDLEQSKQKLIDAQFEWLEAIEKLNNEKEVIEEEFRRFCSDNNFLVVDNQNADREDVSFRQNELIEEEGPSDMNIKKAYCAFQKKYLNKMTV